MVEAAGVEPASENIPLKHLHTYPELWWRRRESNPRPKTFHSDIYILVLNFKSRFLDLLQAGISTKASLSKFRLTWYRHPGSAIPLVDALTGPAGVARQDGSLSSYGVGIIVCDYV